MTIDKSPQVFLSYAREDRSRIEPIYDQLADSGYRAWMDVRDILPGEKWEPTIMAAVRSADFFLACITQHSINKRGFLQKEIRSGLDAWAQKLESDIYLIPVRLEECEVPEALRDFQWLDLFEGSAAWQRLLRALEVGMQRRKAAELKLPSIVSSSIPDIVELNLPEAPSSNSGVPGSRSVRVTLERRSDLAVLYTDLFINNQLGDDLAGVVYELIGVGYHKIVLNLRGTKIINSIGISILIEIIEKVLEVKGVMAFCQLTSTLERTFHIMGLAQYAGIYDTEDEAVAALREAANPADGADG